MKSLFILFFAMSANSALAGQCTLSEVEAQSGLPAGSIVHVQRNVGRNSGAGTNQETFLLTLEQGSTYVIHCDYVPYMGGCACDPAQPN